MDSFIEGLKYATPALVVAVLSWFFLRQIIIADSQRRKFYLQRETLRELTPVRVQAYERFTLLLERIHPESLVGRVQVLSIMPSDYLKQLLAVIDQEFEYNLSQQIYISSDLWATIKMARSQTKAMLTEALNEGEINNVLDAQKAILIYSAKEQVPAEIALEELKKEFAKHL